MTHDCSEHKKDIAGISDMKELAEMIGDLHYETLYRFLGELADKLFEDYKNDERAGRIKLSKCLDKASVYLDNAAEMMFKAYKISKPFMNPKPTP